MRFEALQADGVALGKIVNDMRECGGKLTPMSVWITLDTKTPYGRASKELVDSYLTQAVLEKKMSDLAKMLPLLIGFGQQAVDERAIKIYGELFAKSDPLGLWRTNVEDTSSALIADLWSIMDIDLIWAFVPKKKSVTRILEVGGGYGRLAEAMLNVFGSSVRYVLVDAVPGSLYYAEKYLKRACPDVRIGSYYDDDPFDLEKYECYIAPSWHFKSLNTSLYDVCVNIESFQEMLQEHVDFYLALFDDVTVDGALIYLSNAHDYFFKGSWNYPPHWRKLLCVNTPRSWSTYHPTEVFVKGEQDYSLQNTVHDELYNYGVEHPALGEKDLVISLFKRLLNRGNAQLRKLQ